MKASRVAVLVLAVLALVAVVFVRSPFGRRTQVATGYAARVLCSCRYVGGRDLKSCLTDREPGTEIAQITDDPVAHRITATIPLLARASATADGDYGCTLDPA